MIVRNNNRTRVFPRSGRVTESGSPETRSPGIFPGPVDRADPRGLYSTRRDDRSGKPGTPVRGRYPTDWEPRYEY